MPTTLEEKFEPILEKLNEVAKQYRDGIVVNDSNKARQILAESQPEIEQILAELKSNGIEFKDSAGNPKKMLDLSASNDEIANQTRVIMQSIPLAIYQVKEGLADFEQRNNKLSEEYDVQISVTPKNEATNNVSAAEQVNLQNSTSSYVPLMPLPPENGLNYGSLKIEAGAVDFTAERGLKFNTDQGVGWTCKDGQLDDSEANKVKAMFDKGYDKLLKAFEEVNGPIDKQWNEDQTNKFKEFYDVFADRYMNVEFANSGYQVDKVPEFNVENFKQLKTQVLEEAKNHVYSAIPVSNTAYQNMDMRQGEYGELEVKPATQYESGNMQQVEATQYQNLELAPSQYDEMKMKPVSNTNDANNVNYSDAPELDSNSSSTAAYQSLPANAGTPAQSEQKEDSVYQSLPANAGTPAQSEQKEDSVYQSLPANAGTPAQSEQKEDSVYQSLPANAGTPAQSEQKEDSVYQSLPANAGTPAQSEQKEDSVYQSLPANAGTPAQSEQKEDSVYQSLPANAGTPAQSEQKEDSVYQSLPANAGPPAQSEQKEDSVYQSLPANAGTPAQSEQKEDSVYQSLPAHAASQQADQFAQQPQSNNVSNAETHLKQYEQTGDKLDGTLTQTNMGQGPDRQEMSQQAQQQIQQTQEQQNNPNLQN